MVGKSVKRCDSNREVVLVRVAKSVTGHVKWQVTGRNPTARVSRDWVDCAGRFSQGLKRANVSRAKKAMDPAIHLAEDDRNISHSHSTARAGGKLVCFVF